MNGICYAHSANQGNIRHKLHDHLKSVADLAGSFAALADWRAEALLAGELHDVKVDPENRAVV